MEKKKNTDKRSYILTRETLGMTILLFCFILTVILLTNNAIFMGFGGAICTFMYGTFGYASYFIVALLAYLGEWLVFEKKLRINLRCFLLTAATVLMLFFLFHSVTTAKYSTATYGGYLSQCYYNAAKGYAGYSFGGVISGLFVFPIAKGTTFVGAYVIFSLLSVALATLSALSIRSLVLGKMVARAHSPAEGKATESDEDEQQPETGKRAADNLYSLNENHEIVTKVKQAEAPRARQPEKPAPQPKAGGVEEKKNDNKFSPENLGRRILFQPGEFAAESYRRNMIYNEDSYFNHPVQNDDDYLKSFSSNPAAPSAPQSSTPAPESTYTSDFSSQVENDGETDNSTPSYLYGDEPVQNLGDRPLYEEKPDRSDDYSSYTVDQSSVIDYEEDESGEEITPDYSEPLAPRAEQDIYGLRQDDGPAPVAPIPEPQENVSDGTEESETPAEQAQPESDEAEKPEEKPRERGSSLFDLFSSSNPRLSGERRIEPDVSALQSKGRERSRENLFDDSDGNDNLFGDQMPLADRGGESAGRTRGEITSRPRAEIVPPVREQRVAPPMPEPAPKPEPEPKEEEKPKHVWKKYVRPSLDLLDDYPENTNVNTAEIEESKQIICDTLSDYRIESRISNVVVGPAITRYDVIIEDRTNIKNALKYREAIAMALMKENVNAYLNYSKGAISIEVPNSSRCVVGLKTMLASSSFLNAKPNSLTFTLGKNVEGQVVCPDITKMPHLLVAGTTGSGKSICLSTLIVSLLYKYGPEELRFILVDPKQVEFISYDKLPHLMINEIIYDVDKAIKALNWAIKEMERRYQLFKEMTEKGVATKNLTEYNAHLAEGEEKLPKIVVILDEFGDLMLQAKKDIESRIIRLVQKSRACGIHLILATQRPSVDCITGLIKSNLPTRIGFKVNSFDDARCIFDIGGAEKLLGKGDLYFRSAENPELARIQGCFIDTHEVQKVTDFVKQNNETYFDQSVSDFINTVEEEAGESEAGGGDMGAGDASKVDDTFIKALKFCVTSNQASVSMIQRRFPIGYMKACKIIDWMENMNYITQSEGSKPRKVLLSREEFIQRYGDVDD
ncbi:MAG: FtsK/SpoIIIE domain-containing protein [Roseburia sp.]|nr:FtsK/SpoIIIE domain-containing protein [Roseburia sp.]